MLNVNRMRILREVQARGSIAAAAEALYMTASAVSQQMSLLEREAGVELLDRFRRRVRLTAAGEELVAHTERVLAVLEEAQADLDAIAGGLAGRIAVCAFPTAARSILVQAVAALRTAHPHLDIRATDLEPEEGIPALNGEMDVVVTYEFDHLATPHDPGIERHVLMREPVYLAIPRTHPRATGPVRIADLAEEEWVVGRLGTPFHDVQSASRPKPDSSRASISAATTTRSLLAAVEAGLGITLVPPLGLFGTYPGIVFRVPEDIEVNRRIVALVRAGSSTSPAITAVLSTLAQAAEEAATHSARPEV